MYIVCSTRYIVLSQSEKRSEKRINLKLSGENRRRYIKKISGIGCSNKIAENCVNTLEIFIDYLVNLF